ncbi:MAG: hypothetical protein NTV48_00105 [Candidatus Vogelbacteria bacterium]|nr:hypothetical protein [Candidatus Vogelbacteria bacterium]
MGTKKTLLWLLLAILIIIAAFFLLTNKTTKPITTDLAVPDVRNASFNVAGTPITLKAGRAEVTNADGASGKREFSLFGEPVYGDLNGDSRQDSALMLVESSGGSGTFYYAVFVINQGATSQGSNTLFLGDRIAPQNIEIKDGRAIYNYAERDPNEPMTTPPSFGKSLSVIFSDGVIKEGK